MTSNADTVSPVLQSLIAGVPVLVTHMMATLLLLVAGTALCLVLTPHREIELLRRGVTAAGVSVAGVVVALSLPLAVSLMSSVTLLDILAWGSVAIALQVATYFVVDRLVRGLPQRIEADDLGAALVLVACKLAVAMILAAALVV